MKLPKQLMLSLVIAGTLGLTSVLVPVDAIEYGGIGGKPANSDPKNPRTESIFIYTLAPSEEKQDAVLVVNNSKETRTLVVYATDSQKSTDGAFACEQFSDTKDVVGGWIKLEKEEVTLKPNSNVKIPFKIKVDDNAGVGEENGCIMIQEKKENNSRSGLSLSFRTGLRVAVTIPGEQIRKLELVSFDTQKLEDKRQVRSKLSVKNVGNVSIDAKIKYKLTPIWGGNLFEADNQYPVLRADTAVYNFEAPYAKWGGIFKSEAVIGYDASKDAVIGKNSNAKIVEIRTEPKWIWLMPEFKYLLIELGVLLGTTTVFGVFIYNIIANRRIGKNWQPYTVRSGDDIQSLAANHKLSWKKLARGNRLRAPYLLEPGQIIKLPPRSR